MTQREQHLFTYSTALERGDFATVARMLELAQSDPELERMIVEINAELVHESPVLSALDTVKTPNKHQPEDTEMAISLPIYDRIRPNRQPIPITVLVATIITVLFALFIFLQNQNARPTLSLATTPEQSLQDVSENMTTFQQYLSAWETYDATLLEGIITEDYTLHLFSSGWQENFTGVDQMQAMLSNIEGGFFDGTEQYAIVSSSEDNTRNQLWASVTVTVDTLPMVGITPLTPVSGDAFELGIEFIVSFNEDHIAEVWAFFDTIDLLQQGGMMDSITLFSEQRRNLEIAQNVIQEIWNDANYENIATYYADTFNLVGPFSEEALVWTPADAEDAMVDMHYAFEDLELTIDTISMTGNTITDEIEMTVDALTANRNTVTVEFTATATHTGLVYIGDGRMNPTGEPISWSGIFVYEFEDGQIVEERNYWIFEEYTRAFYGVED